MITEECIPQRLDVPWRNIDGNVIIVRPTEGILCPLNSVATKVWLLVDGTKRAADIVDILVEEFEGRPDEIRKDTLLFLEQLEAAALIKTSQVGKMASLKQER